MSLAHLQLVQQSPGLAPRRQGQLVMRQMAQFQVESIMAPGAEPISGIAAVRAQVELHRQLQVMFALVVAQQQVQLA